MNKGLVIVVVLCLISALIQLLPVISVPITGASIDYNLSFARYNNVAFGVFGICDYNTHSCTDPTIGYPRGGELLTGNENGGVELPSDARSSISKLLVVHVIAFALSAILMVISYIYMIKLWIQERKIDQVIAQKETELNDLQNSNTESIIDNGSHDTSLLIKKPDITPFLTFQLIASLISCLLTLLGLLSDVLLFMPHLSFLGWLQILPIMFLAIVATLVCFMRRSIFSRRHLDEEYFYANDDMRIRRNLDVISSNDTASDDGFYVYTNGFYSNYADRFEHNQSQQSNTNSWIRRTPFNEDDVSIDSNQFNGILERERIQLRDLPRDD